jgi:hypothetical protein
VIVVVFIVWYLLFGRICVAVWQVCMHAWMYMCLYWCFDALIGWLDRWMDGWVCVYVYVCMCICVCVSMWSTAVPPWPFLLIRTCSTSPSAFVFIRHTYIGVCEWSCVCVCVRRVYESLYDLGFMFGNVVWGLAVRTMFVWMWLWEDGVLGVWLNGPSFNTYFIAFLPN